MKTITCGLDMDGVLANWHDAAINQINTLWPELNIKELTTFYTGDYIYDLLKERGVNLSKQKIYSMLCPKEFFYNLEPYPYLYEMVEYLSSFAKIYIVTKPIEWNYTPAEKVNWLKKYLPNIEYKVILTETSEAKGLLNLDFMIDDDPRVYQSWKNEDTLFFIPKQPWNKKFCEENKNNNRIKIIESLSEVIKIFKENINGNM